MIKDHMWMCNTKTRLYRHFMKDRQKYKLPLLSIL